MNPESPALRAALTAIQDDVKRRLRQPRSWFRLLRIARHFRIEHVDPRRVDVKVPRGVLPDCEECLEVCCTGPHAQVSLRFRDIATLVDAGYAAAIDLDTAPKGLAPGDFFAEGFPILRRDTTNTCVLLDGDRRCGAWPHWPLSCARYPYAYDATHRVVFLAKGCRSHRAVTLTDPPRAVSQLVDVAVEGYNQRVLDVLSLSFAREALNTAGLLAFTRFDAADHRRLWPRVRPRPKPQAALTTLRRGTGAGAATTRRSQAAQTK